MNLLRLLLRSSRWMVLTAVAAGLAGGAGSVGLIALLHVALKEEASPGQLAGAFALLCLVVLLMRIVSQALLIRLGQGSVYLLYTHLSRQILAVPLRQLEKLGAHRLLTALTEDVPTIGAALFGIPILCVNGAILLCCLIYLGWLSPLLFAGVLLFLAVGVLSYQLPVLRALGHLHLARQEHDALMKHFRGLTDGVKELKMHRDRREAFLAHLLEATAGRLRDRNTAGMTLYAAAGAWGQVLFFLCIGLLLFAPPLMRTLSRDVVSGYALTILYAVSPLETIMTWLPILGRAGVALRAIDALGLSLTAQAKDGDVEPGRVLLPVYEHLELDGVMHAYRDEEDGFLLGPIDFTLRRGEVVFVVGGNGSGKTTLAKLIVGLYTPVAGVVRLNGIAIDATQREQYRQLFSPVFADAHLFDRLLGMEIALLDAEAEKYLVQLELDQKVRITDGKLSTTELSQGQRKRLALLTAYLEDRPVYVFDEWAADQDPRFKEIFYTRLLPELKSRGKAVLVISHDDRYFSLADRIIKLDYGTLQEVRADHERVPDDRSLAAFRQTEADG